VNIFKDIGWYFRHRDLIGRVISNPDVLALIDAGKELGDDSAPATGSLHEELKKAGIDTKQLAEAIHPEGQTQAQI
jgi:hypothetical protein